MYAIPGILGLIVFTYIRPQEFVPAIEKIPWINLWLMMLIGGFVMDLNSGRIRKEKTPILWWAIFFYFWCFFTMALKAPGEIAGRATYLTTGIGLSLIIQHTLQNLKEFKKVMLVLFVTSMFCVTCAFHQGLQDFQCLIVEMNPEDPGMPPITTPDGRGCERQADCYEQAGADEDADYWCEHVGLFGTTSISTGRVRWRGVLNDPNETTLAAGTSIPMALAFFESKRTALRLLVVLATVVIVVVTDVFSQSRGAILIFLAVMGVYFIRKYGIRGAIVGGAMGAPLMMLGGRSGEEAAQSAEERMEVMTDGLNMFFGSPLFGVGYGQFCKHTFLTAHNAYILAAAELGIVGFWAWTVIVYTLMKVMLGAYKRYATVPGGEEIRAWSLALFASFVGMLVGIFFLSWTYHYVTWIYFGVGAGFYSTIRTTDRGFDIAPKKIELVGLFIFDIGFLIFMKFYMRMKGHV
jgi:hypothetical protein